MTDALMDRIKAHRSAPDVYDPPTFEQMADYIQELEAACWRMKEDRDRALGWRDRDGERWRYAVEVLQSISAKVKASKLPIAGLILHECTKALTKLEGKE